MYKPVLTLFLCGGLWSCKPVVMPAYIHIASVNVSSNMATEGTASAKVVDAWVYIDDDAQGVYELPATFPVQLAGQHEVSILAGVLKDGKSVERIAYPFYSLFTQDLELVPGEVDTVVPAVGYNGTSLFLVIEDFETGTNGFGMNKTTVDSLVFEGNGSGYVILSAGNPSVTTVSDLYPIPADGSRVFMELNYRNEVPFNIYLHDTKTAQDHYIITITPKDLWNKVYVDLTLMANRYAADDYRIKFECELPASQSQAVNYWDNIKILHL